jgi:hypothetical protein
MTPGESADSQSHDEQELINAEFESMVSGLTLDQSSPRTFLDELDDFDKNDSSQLYIAPRVKRGFHGSFSHLIDSIKRWWKRPNSDDGDGAIV